jgi:hypothetical protein
MTNFKIQMDTTLARALVFEIFRNYFDNVNFAKSGWVDPDSAISGGI